MVFYSQRDSSGMSDYVVGHISLEAPIFLGCMYTTACSGYLPALQFSLV